MATGVRIQVLDNDLWPLSGITTNLPNDLGWEPNTPEKIYDDGLGVPLHGNNEQKHLVDPLGTNRLKGWREPMFFNDYYNQVWVLPASLDFGAIGATSSKTFIVWNAYWRQTTTLTSIGVQNGDGVELTGSSVPKAYRPLEFVNYTVTVDAEGPAVVNTIYTLTFSDGMVTVFPIMGTRAKIWPFTVNWADSYKITYDFKTEIITSRAGREQRIAHRSAPRKKVSFTTMLHKNDLQFFKNLMWSWQARSFVLPQVTHKTYSAAHMDPLDAFMTMRMPLPAWLVPGVTLITESGTQREIRMVDHIVGADVYFKSSSPSAWSEGTIVYYAITGYFDQSVSAPRKTSTTVSMDFTLNVVPLSEIYPTPPAPVLMLNGREIFDKRPNWANDVPVTHEHPVNELDYGYGIVSRFTPIDFGTMLRSHTYLARNVEEADAMVDLFRRSYGQQGEFYVPTWEHDMFPKVRAEATTQVMRVAGREFFEAYRDTTVNRGVAVRFKDGSMLYRQVLAISNITDAEGDDSGVSVTEAWGRAIDPADVEYVSWLLVCRFASDSFTIEFLTDSVAQFQTTVRSLENLPPEA